MTSIKPKSSISVFYHFRELMFYYFVRILVFAFKVETGFLISIANLVYYSLYSVVLSEEGLCL